MLTNQASRNLKLVVTEMHRSFADQDKFLEMPALTISW
jgi:hypothetical protein